MTKQEVLERILREVITDDLVRGAAIIGDGINVNYTGERTWWRIEVRDVTALIDAEFSRGMNL